MKSNSQKKPIVRIAPSPTGFFHIGGARTALFNLLFTRKQGGTFILRSEDTDVERSKKEYEDDILLSMDWLGLTYDDFFRQSERLDIYKKYLKEMIHSGVAYVSKEEQKEAGDRAEVIRFKNPNRIVQFEDLIRGSVSFNTTDLGDFVIAKSTDEPLYHLAVVIDDHEMGVTHVIRGEEHLSNTPRQILIQEAIGAIRPIYAHLPLILDSDRKKLSKRKHGEAVWINFYKKQGYLPEALLNYLALLGWNPGTEQELFTLSELIDAFEIEKVQKSGAVFNEEKLKWINKEHMKGLPADVIKKNINERIQSSKKFKEKNWTLSAGTLSRLYKTIFDHISYWGEVGQMIDAGELDYAFESPKYAKGLLFWKDEKDTVATKTRLEKVLSFIQQISDSDFKAEFIKKIIWDYATLEGRGQVLWPMRVALSGKKKSPDPFVLSEILGKEEAIVRLNDSIKTLS